MICSIWCQEVFLNQLREQDMEVFTKLTFNKERHNLLLQVVSTLLDGADIETIVTMVGAVQSQTEISGSKWVVFHLCKTSNHLRPVQGTWIQVDHLVRVYTSPLYCCRGRKMNFGFKGQDNSFRTLCSLHHLQLVD